jgi:molecular chaperone DnaJ
VSRTVFGEFVRSQTCPTCGGAGRVIETPCRVCEGAGRTLEERTLDVEIPPGIHDGQRIRLSGEGHAGMLGGRAGDVYVLVRVRPDPRFARDGNDIFSTIELTMTEAALGARRPVPTLDGEVEIEFAPGTQPGHVVVLKRAGVPVLQGYGRGDHRVLVNVAVPRNLTEEQRALLASFAESEREDTYRADESFFDKLKSHFR